MMDLSLPHQTGLWFHDGSCIGQGTFCNHTLSPFSDEFDTKRVTDQRTATHRRKPRDRKQYFHCVRAGGGSKWIEMWHYTRSGEGLGYHCGCVSDTLETSEYAATTLQPGKVVQKRQFAAFILGATM